MSTIYAAAITTVLTISFVRYGFFDGRFRRNLGVISKIRPRVILSNLVVMTAVIMIGIALNQLPVLSWSWWDLLGSSGNQGEGSNIIWIGLRFEYFVFIFLGLFVVAVPQLARDEEEMFREGTLDWRDAFLRSLGFGLTHCIVGISIAFGLALGISGLWYTHHYFKGGVERSTLYHTTWNLIIVGLVIYFVARSQL